MRMHKNILGGGHLLGNNSPVARRHRCADAGRPLPACGFRRAFRLATASRLSATSASRVVAAGTSLALVLLAGALLFPAIPDAAQAEEAGTKATLVVHPMLSVELQSAVNFDVMPTQDGAFSSSAASLSVSTNNETGYSLYLSTANGESTLASLNPSVTDTIGAVSGTTENPVSEEGFGDNTWGYNLSEGTPSGSLTYQAVPGDSTVQQGFGSEGPTASDTYTLTFGTKVNTSLPSGTYSNQVVVSVVANPAYVPNLTQISNMQDMTTEICNASTVGQTNRLTDTRDGKLYWVAKLADDQCWMTQNLDFDIPEGGLTNENGLAAKTDLPDGTTWATGTEGTITSSSSNTGTFSWDLGYYVKSDPDGYSNYCNGVKTLSNANCTSKGWINVGEGSGYAALTEEQTDTASSANTTYEVTVVDEQAKTYDAHYLVGNMYQYTAATAGTGGSIASTSVTPTGSVCPKGWTLPSRGTSSTTGNDFYGLTTVYSISSNTAGSTAITQAPLYFSPVGHVNSGSLNDAGSYGYYWSSTAYSSTYAYTLYFYSGYVYPSSNISLYRYDGQSVRCLAR